MTEDTRAQLLVAYQHLKAGEKAEAAAILKPIVRADRDNADAWWLLANALDVPDKQRKALQQALDLRPDHAKAQKMLDDLNAQHMPTVEALVEEGDFPFDAEYVEEDEYWARLKPPKPRKSNQTLYILLAVIGGLMVLGCAACFFLAFGMTSFISTAADNPDFAALIEKLAANDGYSSTYGVSPTDARSQGVIELGQTVAGSVGTFTNDRWTFTASAGERVMIELNALDDSFDPVVYLFDANNHWLAEDDDSGPGMNAYLEATLPATGTYTVVVSAFDLGGDYELRLRSRAAV